MKARSRSWRDDRASAAAEFALVLPLLAYIFLNVADFSRYLWIKMQVDLAAQGAVGAVRKVCDTAAELPATTECGKANKNNLIADIMLPAARSTSLGTSVSLGGTNEAWYCSKIVDGKSVLEEVDAINKKNPKNCASSVKPSDYISSTATFSFTPLFSGVTIVPAATVERTAWMRLQ